MKTTPVAVLLLLGRVAGHRRREESTFRRVNILPGVAQRGLRGREGRVVPQCLLDQRIERLGMEQRPPLSWNVQILDKVLRLTTLTSADVVACGSGVDV